MNQIIQTALDRYQDPKHYDQDRLHFENMYPQWEDSFAGLISASLFYENFPYADERLSPKDSLKGLSITYGLLRVIAIAHCAGHHKLQDLINAISAIFRLIDHTAFYYNVSFLEEDCLAYLDL